MKTDLRTWLLALALLALAATPAHAFDYAAHCRMANRALRLAAYRVVGQMEPGDPRRARVLELAEATRESRCDEEELTKTMAYGEWVAQVDWAITPADFFLTPAPGAGTVRTDSVPTAAIQQLVNLPLQDFRLLHENGEHFGAHALYSSRAWHRYALQEARRGNVEAALVYNAFADHYLQDLFAPGHIFAPRRGLNDILTGGIHNAYNRRGLYYHPRDTELLAGYAERASELSDSLRPSFQDVVSEACGGAGLAECVSAFAGDSIAMFGDNQLHRSPRQELFVTLVIARSVEDVLRTWVAGDAAGPVTDSFRDARWCGYDPADSSARVVEWTSPTAETRFGRFRQEEGRGLPRHEKWPTVRGGYAKRLDGAGGFWEVAFERMWTARPSNWLGEPRAAHWFTHLREDLAMHWGVDARGPVDGEVEDVAAGAFVRRGASLNRINARTSYVAGVRARPSDWSVEPHLGGSFELGFSLLHLELRPAAAWNSSDGWIPTLTSAVSVVLPRTGKASPRRPTLPPETPAATPSCDRNAIEIP